MARVNYPPTLEADILAAAKAIWAADRQPSSREIAKHLPYEAGLRVIDYRINFLLDRGQWPYPRGRGVGNRPQTNKRSDVDDQQAAIAIVKLRLDTVSELFLPVIQLSRRRLKRMARPRPGEGGAPRPDRKRNVPPAWWKERQAS